MKGQVAAKQKSVSLKRVNQPEIMGADVGVMRDMSKVLNKRLTSMNDEKQDDLFGILVAAKFKNSPQKQKYRLKHEINKIIFNYKLQNENDFNHSERSTDRSESPSFHTEVNRSFQKAGHCYNNCKNKNI